MAEKPTESKDATATLDKDNKDQQAEGKVSADIIRSSVGDNRKGPSIPGVVKVSFLDMLKAGYEGDRASCNFDVSTSEGATMFLEIDSPGDCSTSDFKETPFLLKYWYVGLGSFGGEDDEGDREGLRIVLISESGQRLTCSSVAVARFLDRVRALCGPGVIEPPMPILFQDVQLAAGRRTYSIKIGPSDA